AEEQGERGGQVDPPELALLGVLVQPVGLTELVDGDARPAREGRRGSHAPVRGLHDPRVAFRHGRRGLGRRGLRRLRGPSRFLGRWGGLGGRVVVDGWVVLGRRVGGLLERYVLGGGLLRGSVPGSLVVLHVHASCRPSALSGAHRVTRREGSGGWLVTTSSRGGAHGRPGP